MPLGGAALAPILILALVGRRKKGKIWTGWVVIALMMSASLTLVGCNMPDPQQEENKTPTSTQNPSSIGISIVTPTEISPATPAAPGSVPLPSSTATCTPTPANTPTPIPTPWELSYGQAIAKAAINLLNNSSDYYIWGARAHPDDETAFSAPPREIPTPASTWNGINVLERTGGKIPIVCADVIALSYANGGLSLYTFTGWSQNPGWQYDPTRNVVALKVLLEDHHQKHQWGDGTVPELGDMVLTNNYIHSAIVAEKLGNDASQVFVIQADYSQGVIDKMSLAEWQSSHGGNAFFGHPDPDRR